MDKIIKMKLKIFKVFSLFWFLYKIQIGTKKFSKANPGKKILTKMLDFIEVKWTIPQKWKAFVANY